MKKKNNPYIKNSDHLSNSDKDNFTEINEFYETNKDIINTSENFPLFIRRQSLSYYLAKYELYKKTLDIKGSIVECGSYQGSSLLLFAKLTSIFEPYLIHRKVISFDTFTGFPSIDKKNDNIKHKNTKKNYLSNTNLDLIKNSIKLLDKNRFNGHINKVEIIKGDAIKTIPKYLKENKHCLVSLLYLDFDIYKPTKIALDHFLPRMSKGSLVVFDELNQKRWYGETVAYLEKFSQNKVELKQFNFEPNISYFKI
jgi:hypothetical protein